MFLYPRTSLTLLYLYNYYFRGKATSAGSGYRFITSESRSLSWSSSCFPRVATYPRLSTAVPRRLAIKRNRSLRTLELRVKASKKCQKIKRNLLLKKLEIFHKFPSSYKAVKSRSKLQTQTTMILKWGFVNFTGQLLYGGRLKICHISLYTHSAV